MISVLFLSIFMLSAATTENHRDMIHKAENLTLQRDRSKALQILKLSLKKEEKNLQNAKEVIQSMDRIGNLFFSEKTQSIYAKGISELKQEASLSREDFKAALAMEPDQLLIIYQLGLLDLKENECAKALDWSKKGLNLHPYHNKLLSLYLQAALCEDLKTLEYGKQLVYENNLGSTYSKAIYEYLSDQKARALNTLDLAIKTYPHSPNLYSLKKKVLSILGRDVDETEKQWKEACKNSSDLVEEGLDGLVSTCPKQAEVKEEIK